MCFPELYGFYFFTRLSFSVSRKLSRCQQFLYGKEPRAILCLSHRMKIGFYIFLNLFNDAVLLYEIVIGFVVYLESLLLEWIGGFSCLLIRVLEYYDSCTFRRWICWHKLECSVYRWFRWRWLMIQFFFSSTTSV